MYSQRDIDRSVQLFKAVADKTRFSILLLLQEGELSVNDIAQQLNMSVSAISHQLKILRLHHIVSVNKVGKYSYYYLTDDHIRILVSITMEHAQEI